MIGSTVNSATYAGNGSTSTAYVIPFRYDASGWVKVTVTNALGEIEDLEAVTDYTLAGTGSTANGTFTTTAAISNTSTVSVYREAPGTQTLSLPANTALPAVAVEAQLDRLAMAAADSVTKRELAARLSELLIDAGVNITTADLLALLAGEVIQPAAVIIPDQGALVPLNEGALVRNGNSLAWAEDPDAAIPGGSIIYDESESFGGVKIAAASYAANTRQVLGSVKIPARYAIPNQFLKVSISYSIYGNSAALPAGTTLGLVTENRKVLGANTIGAVYGWALQEQIHQQVNNFNFQVKLLVDTDATKVYLANPSSGALVTSTRPIVHGTTGNVTVVNDPLSPDELSFDAERSLTLIDDAFVIYLVIDIPASATPSTSIEVGYSMKIRGY